MQYYLSVRTYSNYSCYNKFQLSLSIRSSLFRMCVSYLHLNSLVVYITVSDMLPLYYYGAFYHWKVFCSRPVSMGHVWNMQYCVLGPASLINFCVCICSFTAECEPEKIAHNECKHWWAGHKPVLAVKPGVSGVHRRPGGKSREVESHQPHKLKESHEPHKLKVPQSFQQPHHRSWQWHRTGNTKPHTVRPLQQ